MAEVFVGQVSWIIGAHEKRGFREHGQLCARQNPLSLIIDVRTE